MSYNCEDYEIKNKQKGDDKKHWMYFLKLALYGFDNAVEDKSGGYAV